MYRLSLALFVVAVMSIGGRLGGGQVSIAQATIPQPIYFWGNVAAEISGTYPQPEVIRPSRIFLFANGSWDIEQLQWTGWGSSVAHANGISSASNGIPNMAQGKRTKTPGQITLSSPGTLNGREVYRCFTLTVPPPATNEHMCLKVTGGSAFFLPTTTTTPPTTPPMKAVSPPVNAVRILAANGRACKRAEWFQGQPAVDRSAYGPSCPVTPRLRHWLQTHPEGGSGGNLTTPPPNVIGLEAICRCQNVAPTAFRVSANNGSVALVMELTYGMVTYVVLHKNGAWLVDDTYCTHGNRATTSIYHRPFAYCSA